jgi:serine/threonine-protein kinase
MKTVDARADIYSLGVTLYELLAGQVPFTGPTEFSIHRAHLEQAPDPPTLHYPHIPAPIEQAVLRAMAKNPNDRFQTAEEFADALGDFRAQPGMPASVVQVSASTVPLAVHATTPVDVSSDSPVQSNNVQTLPFGKAAELPAGGLDALLTRWFGRTGNPRLAAGVVAIVFLILIVGGGLGLGSLLKPSPVINHVRRDGGGGGGGPLDGRSTASILPQEHPSAGPGETSPPPTSHAPSGSGTATASEHTAIQSTSAITGRWSGSYQSCEDDSRLPAALDLTESSGTVNGFLSLRTTSGTTARCSVLGSFSEGRSLEFSVSGCSASGLPVYVSNRYKNLLRLQGKELSGSIEPQNPCMLESFRKM